MGWQRVGHDWANEQQLTGRNGYLKTSWLNYLFSFNFDLFLNSYQKDVKKIPNEL